MLGYGIGLAILGYGAMDHARKMREEIYYNTFLVALLVFGAVSSVCFFIWGFFRFPIWAPPVFSVLGPAIIVNPVAHALSMRAPWFSAFRSHICIVGGAALALVSLLREAS